MARNVLILLLFLAGSSVVARAAALYGYEDEYGIVHLSDTRETPAYVLLYEGPEEPALGFDEIRKLIREKGGQTGDRKEEWIAANVPDEPAFRPYPKLRKTGKVLEWIDKYSAIQEVDPKLVYAMIEQESNFDPMAVSPMGAEGLMQIMPEAQETLGLADPFNPEANIAAGVRYLRWMLDKYNGNLALALAAYNAGPGAVDQYGGVPPYPETELYVARITNRYGMLLE